VPAYIQGNLAVEQKSKGDKRPSYKETRKVVVKTKTLPVQEKLLYLFTVIVCVLVASVIIWRYAQIYEMNSAIQKIQTEINNLEAENRILKQKIDELADPRKLENQARAWGMTTPQQEQSNSAGGRNSVASSAQSTKSKDRP